MTSKRIDLENEDWKKKLEKIMEKKTMSYLRERGILAFMNVVIDLPFTKEIMMYPNTSKLKPPPINLYDSTKDYMDHV